MSRYSQYGNFYDPVGSQTNQPSGYSYQTNAPTTTYSSAVAAAPAYGTTYANYGNHSYSSQQYDAGQHSVATGSAAGLNGINGGVLAVASHPSSHASHGTSEQRPTRHSNSPLYAARPNPASASSVTNVIHASQNTHNQFRPSVNYQSNAPSPGTSSSSQSMAYPQQQRQGHQTTFAAEHTSQHIHQRHHSHGSNGRASPHIPHVNRAVQQSSSERNGAARATAAPVTVNPSHVYDNSAELQRQAQIEAEKRRRREAEQLARAAEEERLIAEQLRAEQRLADEKKAEEQRVEEQHQQRERARENERKAEEERKQKQQLAEKKKEMQGKKNERRRMARAEMKRSATAATALQQLSSSGPQPMAPNEALPPATDEESEMRAMFLKMREFNSKNPAMLAKLWEEERRIHVQSQSPVPEGNNNSAAPTNPTTTSQQEATHPRPPSTEHMQPTASPMPGTQPDAPSQQLQTAPTPNHKPFADPAPHATRTTFWPAQAKGALANAACKWLLAQPQNHGKPITINTIEMMLDTHPSYVQLCELFEGNGWKFDRTGLARELLRAAPELSKNPPAAPKAAASAMDLIKSNVGRSGPAAQLSSAAQKYSEPPLVKPAPSGPSFLTRPPRPETDPSLFIRPSQLEMAPSFSPTAFQQHPGQPFMVRPDQHQTMDAHGAFGAIRSLNKAENVGGFVVPPPFSREKTSDASIMQTAPRANGAELKPQEFTPVAQPTAPHPPPSNKEEAARKRTFSDLVDLAAGDSDSDEEGMPPRKIVAVAPDAVLTSNAGPHQSHGFIQPHLSQPLAYSDFMSRTPGKHISGPASQVPHIIHANGFGGPAPPPPQPAAPKPDKPKGSSLETLQQARMKGRMLVEPIMRDRVARKSTYDSRTIARDILLATGRHPDMRGLNAHVTPMQKLLAEHGGQTDSEGRNNIKCDLATIRWDIIDPGEPYTQQPTNEPRAMDDTIGAELAEPVAQAYSTTTKKSKGKKPVDGSQKTHRNYPHLNASLTNDLGMSTSPASHARMSAQEPTDASFVQPSIEMSGPTGYAAFNQVDATGAKKKGRPFGWKKSIHGRAAHDPSSSKATPPQKLPSRLRHSETPTEVEAQYQVYKCRWEGCNAQLHNLGTLKKHIVKLHGRPSEDNAYQCGWRKCAGKTFHTIELWIEHVDKQHLQPIAWKLGDGPRGGSIHDPLVEPESYLSDVRGRSATPFISPIDPKDMADYRSVNLTNNAIQWPTRAVKMPTDPSQRTAIQELQELERHKVAIGAILDRQGCVLASEARRLTFLEDEDFEDEVHGTEHELDEDMK